MSLIERAIFTYDFEYNWVSVTAESQVGNDMGALRSLLRQHANTFQYSKYSKFTVVALTSTT